MCLLLVRFKRLVKDTLPFKFVVTQFSILGTPKM